MFEMRWWGKDLIIETSFTKQLQGGKGKNYLCGGRRSKGFCHPCPLP